MAACLARHEFFGSPYLLLPSSSTSHGLHRLPDLASSQKKKRVHVPIASNSPRNFSSNNDGRHVIVTGGNCGIGKAAALEFARQGMVVTLACRDEETAKAAAAELSRLTNNRNVRSMICDLGSLRSVRSFASEYKDSGLALNVLVNNAGIMACPQLYTEDGFEMQFGVNHLGHFLLTSLLIDNLVASASAGTKSRVVALASAAERIGYIDFTDLNFKSSRAYNAWLAYGQSKLANCLFSMELAKRSELLGLPILSNSMHPGFVDTQLLRYVFPQGIKKNEMEFSGLRTSFMRLFGLRTPDEGASTAIFLASSPKLGNRSGLYFEDCMERTPSVRATDSKLASRLWDVSVELTGASSALEPLGLYKTHSLATL